jgi:hypothetical protein
MMNLLLWLFVAVSCLVCGATTSAADRKPVMVTVRNVVVPTVTETYCVTIDGVDWDLNKLRSEYRVPWTWPDMTEASLRKHMASDHRVPEIDRISFEDLKVIHSVIHEREQKQLKTRPTPSVPVRSACPGGVCPSPMSRKSRGFLFWR